VTAQLVDERHAVAAQRGDAPVKDPGALVSTMLAGRDLESVALLEPRDPGMRKIGSANRRPWTIRFCSRPSTWTVLWPAVPRRALRSWGSRA